MTALTEGGSEVLIASAILEESASTSSIRSGWNRPRVIRTYIGFLRSATMVPQATECPLRPAK